MPALPRKVTKRACDGCKIRKVKCSETPPCTGCVAVAIPCTFNKRQNTRGPRSLRAKTIQEITQTQGRDATEVEHPRTDLQSPGAAPGPENGLLSIPETQGATATTPINTLILQLCVYRLRMFPVWPIIAVEEMLAALQRREDGLEVYALANIVSAATIAQLKMKCLTNGAENVTAASMEAECQRAKRLMEEQKGIEPNINTLRIAFFSHAYHENLEAGGAKSLLYLREAITIAHIIRLHQEETYTSRSLEDQQIRRRLLWLLFMTERGVAMLHKLPPILSSNVLFPSMDKDDEVSILPAFRKLVHLFWLLDQSGAFYILLNSETDIFDDANEECLTSLQNHLLHVQPDGPSVTDVQRADLCVTRQWMRIVLWRVSKNTGPFPIQVGKEFLDCISQLPDSAIESHGPAMELKMYEIANSVANAISQCQADGISLDTITSNPFATLNGIYGLLSKCRGGNADLLSRLREKIAAVKKSSSAAQPRPQITDTSSWSHNSNMFENSFSPPTSQPSLHMDVNQPATLPPLLSGSGYAGVESFGALTKMGRFHHHNTSPGDGTSQISEGSSHTNMHHQSHQFGSAEANNVLDGLLSHNPLLHENSNDGWMTAPPVNFSASPSS